jgi:hypothetical protein
MNGGPRVRGRTLKEVQFHPKRRVWTGELPPAPRSR